MLKYVRCSARNSEYGEMAERSKAAVLKTVDVRASWGSNPYLSAISVQPEHLCSGCSFFAKNSANTNQKKNQPL